MDGQSATATGWILDLNRGSVGSMASLLARSSKAIRWQGWLAVAIFGRHFYNGCLFSRTTAASNANSPIKSGIRPRD